MADAGHGFTLAKRDWRDSAGGGGDDRVSVGAESSVDASCVVGHRLALVCGTGVPAGDDPVVSMLGDIAATDVVDDDAEPSQQLGQDPVADQRLNHPNPRELRAGSLIFRTHSAMISNGIASESWRFDGLVEGDTQIIASDRFVDLLADDDAGSSDNIIFQTKPRLDRISEQYDGVIIARGVDDPAIQEFNPGRLHRSSPRPDHTESQDRTLRIHRYPEASQDRSAEHTRSLPLPELAVVATNPLRETVGIELERAIGRLDDEAPIGQPFALRLDELSPVVEAIPHVQPPTHHGPVPVVGLSTTIDDVDAYRALVRQAFESDSSVTAAASTAEMERSDASQPLAASQSVDASQDTTSSTSELIRRLVIWMAGLVVVRDAVLGLPPIPSVVWFGGIAICATYLGLRLLICSRRTAVSVAAPMTFARW